MASTEIEWATRVWNFARGCRRVSAGCGTGNEGGCYAEKQAYRFSGPGQPYEGLVEMGKHGPRWTGVGRFVPEKLAEPLHVRAPKDGTRHRFFVDSMSDLFYEAFTDEQIAAAFGVMAACPQHDFLILTKRAERLRKWFEWIGGFGGVQRFTRSNPDKVRPLIDAGGVRTEVIKGRTVRSMDDAWISVFNAAGVSPWPLSNVWLGVSAENQETADERIPHLLATPAAVRFVSAEPLLGPIRLDEITLPDELAAAARMSRAQINALTDQDDEHVYNRHAKLDWVIVGGESGNKARPFDIAWGRSIVEQCQAAGTPVFVKQLGAVPVMDESLWRAERLTRLLTPRNAKRAPAGTVPLALGSRKGGDMAEWPEDLRVREFPRAEPAP